MIKNLLNADEDPPPGTKLVIEETVVSPPVQNNEPAAEEASANSETNQRGEVPEAAKFFTEPSEETAELKRVEDVSAEPSAPLDEDSESLSALMADIENLDDEDLDKLESELKNAEAENLALPETKIETAPVSSQSETQIETAPEPSQTEKQPEPVVDNSSTLFQQTAYTPPTTAETIRNMGLSWSAGVVVFGSVIFMMILGWFADLLLGSSPWGLVGGIILGGLIGFVQLFRISSQIYKK